mmetsp:Transcript_4000/g.6795  ORF Transcript_4000/g.6795 Transcript_4000/m.6795 type:complete len:137 (+) Transcript_4000:198-608(+)
MQPAMGIQYKSCSREKCPDSALATPSEISCQSHNLTCRSHGRRYSPPPTSARTLTMAPEVIPEVMICSGLLVCSMYMEPAQKPPRKVLRRSLEPLVRIKNTLLARNVPNHKPSMRPFRVASLSTTLPKLPRLCAAN